jgi:hypothetical protein
VWAPTYDADRQVRDGAWVAEVTGLLALSTWPKGMRVVVRKERPHPAAQLRLTDADGHRLTAFATNTAKGATGRPGAATPPPGPRRGPDPARQGHRADQLAAARLHRNQIWCAIVALASEITAWMGMLALAGHQVRRWEPKRLRLRLFSIAGRLALSARGTVLHLARTSQWTGL